MRPGRHSSAPSEEEAKFYTPVSSPRAIQNHPQRVTVSPTPPSILDQEYADWLTPITDERTAGPTPQGAITQEGDEHSITFHQ